MQDSASYSAFFAFLDKLKLYPEKTQQVIYLYLLKTGFDVKGESIISDVLGGKNNESK